MKIEKIRITEEKQYLKVSAICKIRHFGKDELYFKINKRYKDYIYADSSAFAAALLIPSMKLGEDLIIDGSIPKKLHENMTTSMEILTSWDLGLKKIKIIAKTITKDKQSPAINASFFSGGVDSFYTYLKQRNENDKISHLILINGYDIDLKNKKLWELTLKRVKKIASFRKTKVIEVESNFHELINPILEWNISYVGGLAAVGLMLRNKIKTTFRASSYKYNQIHGYLDMCIGNAFDTESFKFVLDGVEKSRLEKVIYISNFKVVLDNLRVCYHNLNNPYNCGDCDKCFRTMVSLFIAGKLSKAKTFPDKIDYNLLSQMNIEGEPSLIFHKENLKELKRLKLNSELINSLQESINNFSVNHSEKSVIEKAIFFDHMFAKSLVRRTYTSFREVTNFIAKA